MNQETELKIGKISRYLYTYASFIITGLLWDVADGEIDNLRDFIRGIFRAIVMIYLAKTIWDLKLLPVVYFHVVFTVPQEIRDIIRHRQKELFSTLMKAAAQSLLKLAEDPQYIGCKIASWQCSTPGAEH